MENKHYNKQSLYGIPYKHRSNGKYMSDILENGSFSDNIERYNNDYLIFNSKSYNDNLLNYANKYECVYFNNRSFEEKFVDYLSTCNNTHVTFWVNIFNCPNEIKLSDAIESVTMVGIDYKVPMLISKNLKTLYLSGDESCGFKEFDLLPKTITELGLIDACYGVLNIDALPENIKTITIMDVRLTVKKVPSTVEKIIYMPIEVCNGDDDPKYVHYIELASDPADKFTISNPENLKMTINVTKKMHMCRLALGNGDSIVLRFPDKKTADKYLFFRDDGNKLANIVLAIGVTVDVTNYIELGDVTNNDTILDWRHIKYEK